ncbi:unnamed protein product [Amaranthus hypochondriacus]
MELALSLGNKGVVVENKLSVGFCMGSSSVGVRSTAENKRDDENNLKDDDHELRDNVASSSSSDPSQSPLQLDLLPFSPVPRSIQPPHPIRFPWLPDNLSSEPGSSDGPGSKATEVNRLAIVGPMTEETEEQSSPNSGTSSFMEFSLYTNNNNKSGRGGGKGIMIRKENGEEMMGITTTTTTSRGSDDEENGSTRKKLRLSKQQSAFLEESFKEHHTLNPKQKLALAKQLNLRPRQVEVWFQNRRARTKLKQTEVDCEYLKRCCETLTDENRRLQKELQELRALKTSQPFFMQLPATTLTMCPSCERVAPTSSSAVTVAASSSSPASVKPATPKRPSPETTNGDITLSLGKPQPAS